MGPGEISSSTLACQLVVSLCGCFLCHHVIEISWVQFPNTSRRRHITAHILASQLLLYFFPLFLNVPYIIGIWDVFQTYQLRLGTPRWVSWPIVDLCESLPLQQKEASMTRAESHSYLQISWQGEPVQLRPGVSLVSAGLSVMHRMKNIPANVAHSLWAERKFSKQEMGRSHIHALIPPFKKRCHFLSLASPGEF